jgi:hypothetical protein
MFEEEQTNASYMLACVPSQVNPSYVLVSSAVDPVPCTMLLMPQRLPSWCVLLLLNFLPAVGPLICLSLLWG